MTSTPQLVPDYKYLIFEGGGVLGTAYAGCIKILEDKNILPHIQGFAGSSIGALVATALACGASSKFLHEEVFSIDFRTLKDYSYNIITDLYHIFADYGLCHGSVLLETTRSILKKLAGNADITFKEHYERFGKELIVTGTNLSKRRTVYFSHKNTPDMKLFIALRISASFPIIFRPVKYEEEIWLDGGMLNNYPIQCWDTMSNCVKIANPQVLGFKLLAPEEITGTFEAIHDVKTYTVAMFEVIYNQAQKIHQSAQDWTRTIKVNVGNISSTDFSLDAEQKAWLEKQGEDATLAFLTINSGK